MKQLTKTQIFDIFAVILTLTCCLFPWIPSEGGRINIFTYLYTGLKNKEHLALFCSSFLKYSGELSKSVEIHGKELEVTVGAIADCFWTAAFITAGIQFSAFMYAFLSIRGQKKAVYFRYTEIGLLLFLAGTTGNIIQGKIIYSATTTPGIEINPDLIPWTVSSYFILFLLAKIVLLVMEWLIKEQQDAVRLLEDEKKAAQLHRQNIMENYIRNLERMVDEMRAFQHDYKNIMSTMSGYIRENQMDKLQDFFREKIQSAAENNEIQAKAWQSLRHISPMELKGFLYEKMMLIMARRICVRVDISEDLDVKYKDMEDLIRILGIFLDNAIEEAEKSDDGRIGIVIARTNAGILFRIENSLFHKPVMGRLGERDYSTKGAGRGMGLYWAEEILRRHRDMFHEMNTGDGKFIQSLEIIM